MLSSLKEHKVHVKVVFEELRAKSLYMNGKKNDDFLKEDMLQEPYYL